MPKFYFYEDLFIPKYFQYLKNDSRYLLLWGGRDSGKSVFLAQKQIYECLSLPYFRSILVKKTYESIKDSQFQTIKDLVYEYGLDDYFTFSTNPLMIKCFNGNMFMARGCDKPEKLKSIKDPNRVWYEEANQLTEQDFITITTTLRTDKSNLQEALSFNPECDTLKPEDFWIHKHFFSEQREDTTIVHSTYKDNPYCTPDRIQLLENLKKINKYYYDVYTLGRWGVKEVAQPYITAFDERRHTSDRAKFVPGMEIRLSFDFNVDNTICVLHHGSPHYIHFFDELVANNLPELLKLIDGKYGQYKQTFKITGDIAGQSRTHLHEDNMNSFRMIKNKLNLKDAQFKLMRNPPHDKNRFTCNTILAFYPEVIFHPRMEQTIYDIKYVECDDNERIIKKDRSVANQKADFLDGVRYSFNTWYYSFIKRYLYKK